MAQWLRWMKRLLWLLVLLAIGAGIYLLSLAIEADHGYVLFAYKGFRYQSGLWAALAAFLSVAVLALFPDLVLPKVDWLLGRWQHDWTAPQVLGLALFTATAKFLAVWLILLWKPLRMALVPAPLKHARVRDRAVRYFKVGAERRTHGRTGILIYVSLREQHAEILADAARLPLARVAIKRLLPEHAAALAQRQFGGGGSSSCGVIRP